LTSGVTTFEALNSTLARAFQPFTDRVKIEWFNDLTFDAMLQRAAAMPPTTAILWFLLSEDAAGIPYADDAGRVRG
jgi:hypothetical protein